MKKLGSRLIAYKGTEGSGQAKEKLSRTQRSYRDLQEFLGRRGVHDYQTFRSRRKEIDAYVILKVALELGGLQRILDNRIMYMLSDKVDVPRGSRTLLKRFYIKYLYQYECAFLSVPVPSNNEIEVYLTTM